MFDYGVLSDYKFRIVYYVLGFSWFNSNLLLDGSGILRI